MKITAIKAQVKNQARVSVYVDGAYDFSLDQSQLLTARLFVGKELTTDELATLKDESEFGKAYARALDYIMRRPRSIKEMHDYAWRKQWPKDMAARVIEKLTSKGYLDDQKFARAWVRHRAMGKPISQRKLQLELKQKGVSDEYIASALAASSEFDEAAALQKLIEKKRGRYSDEQKFIAYLVRQGYLYDNVRQALSELAQT